ncbi:MAG: alanine racemase [Hyphomicrobiales bacterium]|nr:alanine racemase [Hyphomicrobiales bacterium]
MTEFSGPAIAESQAVLTIDLGALAENWRALAKRVAPAECGAVVKADAYGVGIEAAAPALAKAGCKTFFVALPSEGRRVRAVVPHAVVYVLNGLFPPSIAMMIAHDLRPVLGSLEDAALWEKAGRMRPCALHVDTGMNRLGVAPGDVETIARMDLAIDVLMTHFVSSEDASDATNDIQIARFASVRGALPHARASLANSSALFLPQKPFGDLVRPGYALYGGNPTPGAANPMCAVVRLEAPLLQTRVVEPGETVGYNAQWTAKRRTRLATIGVGYADGLPRAAMGIDDRLGGEAMVAGVRCAFAGRVSMDLTIIDVTDVPAEKLPGASALLLCDDITIDDLGLRAATIGYEILTRLGARYHRAYVG